MECRKGGFIIGAANGMLQNRVATHLSEAVKKPPFGFAAAFVSTSFA